jgi:hypothetical protein
MGFMDWLNQIFSSKYVLIHTALGDEDCIRTIGKLEDAGIVHKTKIRGIYGSSASQKGWGRKQSQYDIYVEKERERDAYEAIHYR